MKIKFQKITALGNDYIYIDCLKEKYKIDWNEFARKVCRRHFGIGANGVVIISESREADYMMRLFNNDGSESEVGGSGLSGVMKYLYDNGITKKKSIEIETLSGIKVAKVAKLQKGKVSSVNVCVGEPVTEAKKIPVKLEGKVIDKELKLKNQCVYITCVSVGNPNCIVFVDTFSLPIESIGPEIENHKIFPNRTNVEFVQIVNRKEINMQVWERGTGITIGSGSGACASVVASVLNKKTGRIVKVNLLGGEFFIEWSKKDNNVYLEGKVEFVYKGEYDTS